MKTFQLCFVIIFAMLGGVLPAYSQSNDKHCLEKVWDRTNPTEAEKKFDLENDSTLADFIRYSCESGISATEASLFLEGLKSAIENDDKESFADFLIYPFTLYPEDEFLSTFDNNLIVDFEKKSDIIQHYNIIATNNLKKMLSCANVTNLNPSGPFGILFARGYFAVIVDENNVLKLDRITGASESAKLWYLENCE